MVENDLFDRRLMALRKSVSKIKTNGYVAISKFKMMESFISDTEYNINIFKQKISIIEQTIQLLE